jgi:hypothetical protein
MLLLYGYAGSSLSFNIKSLACGLTRERKQAEEIPAALNIMHITMI